MIQTVQPRIVTPVVWLEAPEFLTPEEASALTGHSDSFIQRMIDADAVELVEAGDGYLIEKESLYEFQESLALLLHWDD